jgi:tetratricopeptide (TPR) repeat protein
VRPTKNRAKVSIFDVAPTVLALEGVPADRRMTGRPVAAAFTGLGALPKKDLFGTVVVRRVAAESLSTAEASEYAKKLRALGYLTGGESRAGGPAGGDRPGMTEGGWNNLGVYLREEAHDLPAAEAALQKSLELRPDYASPIFNLAILYRMKSEDPKAQEWLFRSLDAGHAEPERTIADWVGVYEDQEKLPAARALLERAVQRYPDNEPFARELALLKFKRWRDCPGALDALSRFESKTSETDTLNALALFQTCLGRRKEAVALFERSLALKRDQPAVVQSLNMVRRGN